jgi:hypothetical protein
LRGTKQIKAAMNFNQSAIATKLNILDSAIIEIHEWASVLWVKFIGGTRFVSKKIGANKMERNLSVDYLTEKFSDLETIVRHFNTGAWVRVNNSNGKISAEFAQRPHTITEEHKAYAISQALAAKTKPTHSHTKPAKSYFPNSYRKSCLNCDITNSILSRRGYCTDCDGEC